MKPLRHITILLLIGAAVAGLAGCVTKPDAADDEVRRLEQAGQQFGYSTTGNPDRPRPNPTLPEKPQWQDVLRYAFLANGDLEAAFHEWAMAIERIDQAGTWPTSNLELGFEYMFSSERMKTFDRMTFAGGLMDATSLPNKTFANSTVAWREAQAAGERFRAMKFDLQMRVLQAWSDYALLAERVRIQEQNVALLRLVSETAASRVRAGGAQQEQLRASVELKVAENELQSVRSSLKQQQSTINALLRRGASDSLPPPAALGQPRPLSATDDQLLAAGVANSPELAALGADAAARTAAIHRAKLEYLPEINPMAAFTGTTAQSLGAAIVLPTQFPRIRAMINEARADLRRVEASLAQAQADRAGRFAATIVGLRDAERRIGVFDQDVIPLAERTVDLTRRAYAAGTATYLDVIDSQRTLLDARLMSAEAKTMREKMLAELEALAGIDVETLKPAGPTTAKE